jgi:hypothetical protein
MVTDFALIANVVQLPRPKLDYTSYENSLNSVSS